WTPVLHPAAKTRRALSELRTIDTARHGEIRMGVHVFDPAIGLDVIDQSDMAVGVVDGGTSMKRARLDFGRIEIRKGASIEARIGTVSGRGNIGMDFLKQGNGIQATAVIDQIAPRTGAVAATIKTDVTALAG